jgi:2-desacetyl-2-hydroxyethyl bacteriochlorophyllide A dehydrogenase
VERVVTFAAPSTVAVVEIEERTAGPGEVRVRTLLSGISAGTELTAYRGSNPYLNRRWDGDRRLFVDGEPTLAYPVDDSGYEEVGEIVEVGRNVNGLRPGLRVWGAWGHRSGAVVGEDQVARRVLDDDAAPLHGVFARIGAVALNAILDADVHVGETVAIFGQGVPGLIATQLARLSGAAVVAVDRVARRRELAATVGAAHAVDASETSAAEAIRELTGGRGADVSIDLSGSYAALGEAIRATAYGSRVVVASFHQGGGDLLRLGEEFHHNRIELVSSQIGGAAPRLAHRWTPLRLERTIIDLARDGRLELERLVTHVVPVERAPEAFRLLDEHADEAVQVVLDFA